MRNLRKTDGNRREPKGTDENREVNLAPASPLVDSRRPTSGLIGNASPFVDSRRLTSDLIGKSFQYGGRGPFEYDCYGLVMEIYKRRGIELPDFGSSPSSSWIHRVITEEIQFGVRGAEFGIKFVELKQPEPFCIVTFALRPPYTSHIGVVLEDGVRFIHIMAKTEVTIERIDSLLWKRRVTGYFKPCVPDLSGPVVNKS